MASHSDENKTSLWLLKSYIIWPLPTSLIYPLHSLHSSHTLPIFVPLMGKDHSHPQDPWSCYFFYYDAILQNLCTTWLHMTLVNFLEISFLTLLTKAPASSCMSYFTLYITYWLQKIWVNVISLKNTWHLISNHYIALDWHIWKIYLSEK